MKESHTRWSSRTKLVVSLLLLGLVIYLLFRFSAILPPLILSVILAFVLSPGVNLLQNRFKLSRTLATFLIYLLLIAILIILPLVIIPPLGNQSTALNLDIQRLILSVEELLSSEIRIAGQVIYPERIFEQVVGSLQGLLEPVFGETLGFLVDVVSSLVWIVFITVASFYLVKDGPKLHQWVNNLVPQEYQQDFERLNEEINRIWGAFFRGQLVLALVVSAIMTVAGFILGLPFALAMGVLAGLLEFLPSIGHAIWLVIASLLALFLGSTWIPVPNWAFMLIIIGLHFLYQQFDLNYLIPRIIGRSVNLPPLVVILGIVSGAILAGVLGILLAAPVIASARVLGRYVYANLFDLDPFQTSVVAPLPPPDPQWWRRKTAPASPDLSKES